jgi:hypothetical protein
VSEKPKRPWFRFHLGTAIMVMLTTSIMLALVMFCYEQIDLLEVRGSPDIAHINSRGEDNRTVALFRGSGAAVAADRQHQTVALCLHWNIREPNSDLVGQRVITEVISEHVQQVGGNAF